MAWGNEWNNPKIADEIINSGTAINAIWQNSKHLNKMPTHDPYTNPDSQIYYECKCGAILDPGTKSFASLNNYASALGWKIRFSERGYIPHCVKCGEGVE